MSLQEKVNDVFWKIGLVPKAVFKVEEKIVVITCYEGGGGPNEAYVMSEDELEAVSELSVNELEEKLYEYQKANWGYY